MRIPTLEASSLVTHQAGCRTVLAQHVLIIDNIGTWARRHALVGVQVVTVGDALDAGSGRVDGAGQAGGLARVAFIGGDVGEISGRAWAYASAPHQVGGVCAGSAHCCLCTSNTRSNARQALV